MISRRIRELSPSPTLAITAKAKKMRVEGVDVIGFGAGEPDFDTPAFIKNAAKKALDAGLTKYTPTSGTQDLKEAVCLRLKRENHLEYSPHEILVSCGAKHSIFNAILALCDEEDEVILPAPYWVSYPEMVKVAGGRSVIVSAPEEKDFKITPDQLRAVLTPKSKVLILNSPSNPTGMLYTRKELEGLAEVIVEKGLVVISDEIYDKLIYDGQTYTSLAVLGDAVKRLTLTVNGMSKAYSMTGWRIGYTAGPREIIQAMSNLQDHSTSNPNSIAQAASVEALRGNGDDLNRMVQEFQKRRDVMVEKVNAIPGLSVRKPQGAFYCFVNVRGLFGKKSNGQTIENSFILTELLLAQARVAVVPGSVFGDDGFIRLSYATSLKNIDEGLKRLEEFAKKVN